MLRAQGAVQELDGILMDFKELTNEVKEARGHEDEE